MCILELLFTMLHIGSFVLEREGKIMWSSLFHPTSKTGNIFHE